MATKKPLRRKIAGALSYVFLVAFCVLSTVAAVRLYSTYKVKDAGCELRALKGSVEDSGESVEWEHELLAVNEDFAGWLTVYGTSIDAPVVKGEDNAEYLHKDFYGEYSPAGTLFLDETVDPASEKGNKIVYGHMMADGTMFGSLKQYKHSEFFLENNIIRWEDRFGTSYYKLFAALIVSGSTTNTNYLNIQQWAGKLNEAEAQEMLEVLKNRAFLYKEDLFRGEGDYIFLVTCESSQYQGKLILVGEKLD